MIFIYILSGIAFIIVMYFLIKFLIKVSTLKKIENKFIELGFNVKKGNKWEYDFILEKNNKIKYVKVIFNYFKHEINVNSRDYFQRNKGVVASRKKGARIEKIYGLIEMNTKDERIYLIYPSSVRLMKVINECEMVFIDKNTDIYGTKMLEFTKVGEDIEG